ncbi:spatzle-like protein isoform X1 [Bombyx mori]|uniref:Spaetzle domain-containing protein n=2 Tax=Bombyx mori TaxID=7091 RepID=A0A8R2G9Z1_BOMMO|nr:spatzle-like protein isoform X1 [Bombyx mori]
MLIAIAFLFVAIWTGGSYGADYATACARSGRSHRGRMPQVAPCDLSKHNYCTAPGTSYPWNAIRRFVRENQGLMKRMYGEERHISILKSELENYIEDDYEEPLLKQSGFAEDIVKAKMMYTKTSQGRAMKDRPYFRPINSEKTKKTENDTLKVKPLEIIENKTIHNDDSNRTESNNDEGLSYKTKLESIANIEINNLDQEIITLEAVIKQSIETNSIYPKSSTDIDAIDEKNTTDISNATSADFINTTDVITDKLEETTESGKDGWNPMNVDTSTLPPTLLFSEHERIKIEKNENKINEKKDEVRVKPQHQEGSRPAVIKLGGANACESTETLTAPFWANSTRGEVLALLNMHPFEQYIHMETCLHERKQMYCREGCRCEQQYRLHRLLAYDPRNECRGIFADWFRFPTCCVCKCYDVPVEFRARSPRILHPQYDEKVKRVIFEDVARDWYMSAYDDEDFL